MTLDRTDSRLLSALQSDAQLTAQQLGDMLGLSPSQVGRRRQRLEAEQFITGYHARLNPARVGLTVQAFIQVQMAAHTSQGAESFQKLLKIQPEIVSAWTLTGEADYRTPMSESEQYYQALKLNKVDTALIRVPGASHGIAARPSQLIAKVDNILAWFARYDETD